MKTIKVFAASTDRLNDDALFARIYNHASAERQKKTDAFRFRKDKNLSLAAEYLLQYAARDCGVLDFTMEKGEHGKPFFANENVYFNLSHSENRVMCAIGLSPVGCDVEKIKPVNLKIAERFFCPQECETICKCASDEEKYEVFFRFWTLKESFMKVTGLGMTLPLHNFCMDINGASPSVVQNVDSLSYHFREFAPTDGYCYAVCSLNSSFSPLSFVEIK